MMTGTKKKSLGASILIMAMMGTLVLGSIPAFAEETENEQVATTTASTSEQESSAASNGNDYTLTRTVASSDTPYTWTIPTAIDWTAVGGEGKEGLYKCSVDFKIAPSSGEAFIILENGKSLQLTVSSGNGWKLKGTNDNELAYTATKDGAETAIVDGDTIFDVASGSDDAAGQTVKVNFATTEAAKIADTYTDTLTFTSDIVDTPVVETVAEPTEEDYAAANAVIALIEKLDPLYPDYMRWTEANREKAGTYAPPAREAYDNLTDIQKSLVTNIRYLEQIEECIEGYDRWNS